MPATSHARCPNASIADRVPNDVIRTLRLRTMRYPPGTRLRARRPIPARGGAAKAPARHAEASAEPCRDRQPLPTMAVWPYPLRTRTRTVFGALARTSGPPLRDRDARLEARWRPGTRCVPGRGRCGASGGRHDAAAPAVADGEGAGAREQDHRQGAAGADDRIAQVVAATRGRGRTGDPFLTIDAFPAICGSAPFDYGDDLQDFSDRTDWGFWL